MEKHHIVVEKVVAKVRNNIRILTGSFIQNEDDEEYNILDQFKITK